MTYTELIEEMVAQDTDHPGIFIALWPPEDIASALAVDGGEAESDLHLTLAYCKDADPTPVDLARLVTGLESLTEFMAPLEAKIAGLGLFRNCGGSDGKHVLYASVDAPDLDIVRSRVNECLMGARISRAKDHGYTPHITLEYIPTAADPSDQVNATDEAVSRLFGRTGAMEFKFTRLILARGEERLEFELRGRSASEVSPTFYESLQESSTAGPIALDGQLSSLLAEAASDKSGSKWRVLMIKAGTSGNRVHYSEEVLRRAAPLFEGVRAYADHPSKDEARSRPERSVRDIVGWYDNVSWDPTNRGLTADFNVLASADWLRESLLDSYKRGKPDLYGFSINATGTKSGRLHEGGYLLESIDSVRSTDVVTVPGAGGRVLDVLESDRMDPDLKQVLIGMRTAVLEAVRARLLEKWQTKGRKLSAAHKAKISAALKSRHSGGAKAGPSKKKKATSAGGGKVNSRTSVRYATDRGEGRVSDPRRARSRTTRNKGASVGSQNSHQTGVSKKTGKADNTYNF